MTDKTGLYLRFCADAPTVRVKCEKCKGAGKIISWVSQNQSDSLVRGFLPCPVCRRAGYHLMRAAGEVTLIEAHNKHGVAVGGLYVIQGYDVCHDGPSTIATWISVLTARLADGTLPDSLRQSDANPDGLRLVEKGDESDG